MVKSLDRVVSAQLVGDPTNSLHLGNIANVADAGRSGEFCRVLFVLVQFRIDVLGDVGERFRGVLGPEEIFGVEVV